MKRHPPYHLRLNKAVDRLTLVRSISKLEVLNESLKDYTYYGLGGPYLEDYKLIYDFHPEIHMVSFEDDVETFKRQEFHRPCGTDILELRLDRFNTSAVPSDKKSICWLDYTSHSAECVTAFSTIVGTVPANSIVKITLCAERQKILKRFKEGFCETYKDYLHQTTEEPSTDSRLAELFQSILHTAILKGLPPEMDNLFQIISSHYYIDGGPLVFTLAGIVCAKTELANSLLKKPSFSRISA